MEKCIITKTGEEVDIEFSEDNSSIYVYYKGKKHIRPASIIGNALKIVSKTPTTFNKDEAEETKSNDNFDEDINDTFEHNEALKSIKIRDEQSNLNVLVADAEAKESELLEDMKKFDLDINDNFAHDSDDLARKQIDIRKRKAAETLKYQWGEWKKCPYYGRIIVESKTKDKILSVYISKNPYIMEPQYESKDEVHLIVDWRSEFGKHFPNRNEKEFACNGFEYALQLKRELNISDSIVDNIIDKYNDSDSDNDSAVYDEFLRAIIVDKRRKYALTDIIRTIQENQNKIICLPEDKNIVVQGCAGSGKTMILLHRLSTLLFNRLINPERTVIITPNDSFNLFINELSEELQLDKIKKYSVEQFYKELLEVISSQKIDRGVLPESNIDKQLLNDLYSVELYDTIISRFSTLIEREKNRLLTSGINEIFDKYNLKFNKDELIPQKFFSSIFDLISNSKSKNEIYRNEKLKNEARILKNKNLIDELNNNISVKSILNDIRDYLNDLNVILDKTIANENSLSNNLNIDDEETELQIESIIESLKAKKNSIISLIVELDSMDEGNLTKLEFESTDKRIQQIIGDYNNKIELLNESNKKIIEYTCIIKGCENKILALERDCLSNDQIVLLNELGQNNVNKIFAEFERNIIDEIIEPQMSRYNLSFHNSNSYRFYAYVKLLIASIFFDTNKINYNYLNIDEAQDISVAEYKLIKKVLNQKTVFNLYGDTHQLVYEYKGIENWENISFLFDETFELNENYRNTAQINEYCNNRLNLMSKSIGITGDDVSELDVLDNTSVSDFKSHSGRKAIICKSIEDSAKIISNNFDNEEISFEGSDNKKISVLTVEKAKGLEFESVLVISSKLTNNEKYISYTRALDNLYVCLN